MWQDILTVARTNVFYGGPWLLGAVLPLGGSETFIISGLCSALITVGVAILIAVVETYIIGFVIADLVADEKGSGGYGDDKDGGEENAKEFGFAFGVRLFDFPGISVFVVHGVILLKNVGIKNGAF